MTGKNRPACAAGTIRTLAAGLLALCFVVDPTVGSLTWLNLERTLVRRAVDRHIVAGIEDDNLVLLRFFKEETGSLLRWEHSREFEYNGQMYDIVETWALGDTVYYRCWWDREETALNNRIRVLAARAMGDAPKIGDPGDAQGSSLRSLPFLLAGQWQFRMPGSSGSRTRAFSVSYMSVHISPPSPPPWPA